jgi:FkbM family methyltransferase
MDLKTPFRFVRAITSRSGRRRYYEAYRNHLWNYMCGVSLDEPVYGKLRGNLRMRLNLRDSDISKAVFVTGVFESAELDYICRTVGPGATVVDVGANIGTHTLTLANCIGRSGGGVHSFDPSEAFDILTENIHLNHFQDRVTSNRCAVGEKDGTLQLAKVVAGCEGYISRGTPSLKSFTTAGYFEVPMVTLDSYAASHNLHQIDFLKVDIEGGEPFVLAGAQDLLKGRAIRNVMFEVNERCLSSLGFNGSDLVQQLRASGFDLFLLGKDGRSEICPDHPRGKWITVVGSVCAHKP